MSKFDPVVISQAKQISAINLILTAIENVVFLVLGKWDYTVLLGSLFGWFIACLVFVLIGVSVQKAMQKDSHEAQNYMKLTYMGRMAVMAAGIFLAIKLSIFNWIAAILPLAFTRISIALLNLKKKED